MAVREDTGRLDRPQLRADGGAVRRARALVKRVQRDLRSSEIGQILLCAALGAVVGALVAILRNFVAILHRLDFALPPGAYLSATDDVSPFLVVLVPASGGLIIGLWTRWLRNRKTKEVVDPVEANALLGGRMSLRDSLRLTLQTLIANASGASLGMEAGYSQFGAGVYSWIGQYFQLRRADLRVFVTAGAGAAIAAAFNAPLAGAFYGYELILGSYMPRALAPVCAASLTAAIVQRSMAFPPASFEIIHDLAFKQRSYMFFALMGVAAAGVGVLTMKLVTWTESGLRKSPLSDWMRPVAGGFALSWVALVFPQVLGSGHGAIQLHLDKAWPLLPLVALLAAKILASAISVGSGFRGGLFSSSLLIGCLFGSVVAQILAYFIPSVGLESGAFMLVGMGSVAAAIIGAPFTMVFLVLEATGDFPVTAGVLVGVITASTIVRLTFGYSFATWRFHQRGLGIRSPHDIGWIAELTAGRLMRADAKAVPADMTLRHLRERYPVGSAKRLFVTGQGGLYLGTLDVALAHEPGIEDELDWIVAGDLASERDVFLLPTDNVRTALLRFEEQKTESIAVVSSIAEPKLMGYLTEAYALRRYTTELERRRNAELGQSDLFTVGPPARS
jgi:CIC family chloride channel protein